MGIHGTQWKSLGQKGQDVVAEQAAKQHLAGFRQG